MTLKLKGLMLLLPVYAQRSFGTIFTCHFLNSTCPISFCFFEKVAEAYVSKSYSLWLLRFRPAIFSEREREREGEGDRDRKPLLSLNYFQRSFLECNLLQIFLCILEKKSCLLAIFKMVSNDSPQNPATSMLHQFIISDSITGQNQFEHQHLDAYGPDLRGNNNTYPQSLGLLPSIQSLGERMSRSIDLVQAPGVAEESEISHTRHLMDLLGASNESNHQAQRLSLSLGPHMLVPSDIASANYLFCGGETREVNNPGMEHVSDDGSGTFTSSSTSLNRSCSTDGTDFFATAVGNSRFLRPTQSLLEEVVNVGGRNIKLYHHSRRGGLRLSSELKADFGFLSAENHEHQMKIAKLISLLEEVESKYEKYYHQMEEVISSFEVIAGLGAAKSYTVLALEAMSRHFGSLRDSIISQINATTKRFSQDLPKISSGLSQLSLFDKETRHNRTSLQQLGMFKTQRQVWRPIRGLPDTSVAILRTWLFEHFLHPYPNESEKLTLASQTGLTKNQVSNWFINARVRLWKPMIEEMYKEEFADSSEDSNPSLTGNSATREATAEHAED